MPKIYTKMTNETTNTIRNIINELLKLSNEESYPELSFSKLSIIVEKHNTNNVLQKVKFLDSKIKVRELLDEEKISVEVNNDPYKVSFLENSIFKGIELIQDSVDLNSNNKTSEKLAPVLTENALSYRHNNDKNMF